MKHEPAKFTREKPCTKVHIWNCFKAPLLKGRREVVVAQSIIGLNTPKYLLREGFVKTVSVKSVDYYELTSAGDAWLEKGVRAHLNRHPSDALQLTVPVPGVGGVGAPARASATRTRIVRRK